LRHPLHSNGLLRMDRPTENPASNSVTVLLRSNVLLVTMEMKSTVRCCATDICRLLLMWEAPTKQKKQKQKTFISAVCNFCCYTT
jgi:hypothetical protein